MKTLIAIAIFFTFPLDAQISYNVAFYGHLDQYTGGSGDADYSEIWGWTNTQSNKEYAIIGTSQGTSIVDISQLPLKEVSFLVGPPSGYNYHEFRTYQNYLYIGAEGTDPAKRPGIQIVDLSSLPDSSTFIKTYTWIDTTNAATNSTKLYNRAHTVSIDKHYLYINGGDFGGTRIMDISDPVNPMQVGSYGKGSTPYVHDSYIRNDTLYAAAINAGRLDIVDFTVKGNYTENSTSQVVSKTPTVPEARTHQVWLSDDGSYMFVASEVTGGHLHIYDITNKSAPVEISSWTSDPSKSIHNVFIKDDFLYIAYYGDGLRILDVKNPSNPIEVAFYNTYPGPLQFPHHSVFHGAWGVYPYFSSGKIAVSDMNTGLYILIPSLKRGGNIVGIIRDASTNQPINGAQVKIVETGRIQVTSATGIYRYGNANGMHSVVFSRSGYKTDTLSILTKPETTDTVYVYLQSASTAAGAEHQVGPEIFQLEQNYPNPFNPSTVISYTLPQSGIATVIVTDVLGRTIETLVDGYQLQGKHFAEFRSDKLSSGVYFYRLTQGNFAATKKMIVAK